MEGSFNEFFEILEGLIEDMPHKSRNSLLILIEKFKKKSFNSETVIEFQEDLETVINNTNIDSYTRTEILNIISDVESMI